MVVRYTWRPSIWITCITFELLATIINFIISAKKIRHRRNKTAHFATKGLQIFSIICTISASMSSLFLFLGWVPGTCYFGTFIGQLLFATESCMMGYYQLCRLYHCFANNQAYSQNGYPVWLFVIMFIIVPLANMNWFVSIIFYDNGIISTKCGIDDHYRVYQESLDRPKLITPAWIVTAGALTVILDVATLLLYIFKLRQFKNYIGENEIVYNRILRILQKTLFLTLFYQIVSLILLIVAFVSGTVLRGDHDISSIVEILFFDFLCVAVNYSMYLMMDHNQNGYIQFLKVIKLLKLNWFCCKWRYFVNNQLLEFEMNTFNTANEQRKVTKSTQTHTQTDKVMSRVISK